MERPARTHALSYLLGIALSGWIGCGDAVGVPIRAAPLQARDAGLVPDATPLDTDAAEGEAEVPNNAHCAAAAAWPVQAAEAERQLYEALEAERTAAVFVCGQDAYRDLSPLTLSPALRCSARLHSADMVARDFLSIENPDGLRPAARMAAAGLAVNRWGELFHKGGDHRQVLRSIIEDNPLGCLTLTNPAYSLIGIGYADGVWTLDFAEPR